MKTANSTRSRAQIYSVGNYLMTGKVLGKGHFARVEEATHRIIGKKVAIKIIDLTLIKEEYARRNLHREPRVMAKLRHPCIAALYETMMHGPRLYVVMEVAGGGDLCTHVLSARGPSRGLPEARARALAAQLVSAVRHMHARGVVHRDLKMENIMLDSTKQFIKIVDFGLSNMWSAGGKLHTPCGSLEYAAPELFVVGHRYGPEVDLWSIGVIVYGMVTGGLPFTGAEGGSGRSRPQLRAAIARGFTRKQRSALSCVSAECRTFIESLLEPKVEVRMKIEEAARHRWVKRPGLRMRVYPLPGLDTKATREIYKQISDVCSVTIVDVVAQIKADPFGSTAGIYNIKSHLLQIHTAPGVDLLWSSNTQEARPLSPPEYRAFDLRAETPSSSKIPSNGSSEPYRPQRKMVFTSNTRQKGIVMKPGDTFGDNMNGQIPQSLGSQMSNLSTVPRVGLPMSQPRPVSVKTVDRSFKAEVQRSRCQPLQSPRMIVNYRPTTGAYGVGGGGVKKPAYKYDSGDCGLDPRLPSIDELSSTDIDKNKKARTPFMRKMGTEEERDRDRRLYSCPNRIGDGKRQDFFRRSSSNHPIQITNWRAGMTTNTSARILLQSNATTIKRASLGNIVSPHSSSNSHCKSERAMPVSWLSGRGAGGAGGAAGAGGKDPMTPLQRLRRTAPIK